MTLLNGIDAARDIVREYHRIKVIMPTMHTEKCYFLAALQAGITGYVVKTEAASDLVKAIYEVMGGSIYLSSKISRATVLSSEPTRTRARGTRTRIPLPEIEPQFRKSGKLP